MTPIHELIARIRWDREFGAARFVIGYHDRITGKEMRVPLDRIHFEPGERFTFDAVEADGTVHQVPFHRVRDVWRDEELIWHRDLKNE